MSLFRLFKRRTEQERQDAAYRDGYRYVAGELLRWDPLGNDPDPRERVSREYATECDPHRSMGMDHAIRDWLRWIKVRANL